MSLPKTIIIGAIALFGIIAFVGLVKKSKKEKIAVVAKPLAIQEIAFEKPSSFIKEEEKNLPEEISADKELPEADNIDLLLVTDSSKLPLVETITYTSRVPWLTGRHAWLADYASHYETTRHFIARSLNKKVDYYTQKVAPGDRFNVLKKDVSFYLLIDLSRSKMWFYGIDEKTAKRYLLKTYKVGLGRKDTKKVSGCLTPKGRYLLGSKVAIYKPGTMGYFQDRQIEMIRVFGTRWLPFEKEIEDCSDGAKGYGIHGAPWYNDPDSGKLIEDRDKVGKYESDGCIRLYSEDIEEIFAITISKPTIVELANDFAEAKIPGNE